MPKEGRDSHNIPLSTSARRIKLEGIETRNSQRGLPPHGETPLSLGSSEKEKFPLLEIQAKKVNPQEGSRIVSMSIFPKTPKEVLAKGTINLKEMLHRIKKTGDLTVPTIDFERYKGCGLLKLEEVCESELKPYRNILAAYFLEGILPGVDEIRKNSPPFGLTIHESDKELPVFGELSVPYNNFFCLGAMRTWDAAIAKWQLPLKNWVQTIPEGELLSLNPNEYTQEQRLFAKFWYTTQIINKRLRATNHEPLNLYQKGVSTASRFAPLAVRLGADVYLRDAYRSSIPDEEHIRRMADIQPIYPLTLWIAGLHKNHADSVMKSLTGKFVPPLIGSASFGNTALNFADFEYFQLEGFKKPLLFPKIELSWLRNEEEGPVFSEIVNSPRTKCIALFAKTSHEKDISENIISYQLKWAAEVAKQMIFPEMLRQRKSKLA